MVSQVAEFEAREVRETVQTPQGPIVVVKTITVRTLALGSPHRPAKDCKFFVVTKDTKLEPISVEKARTMLKTKIAVLYGESADVDPRTLELVKPGTLCVIPIPIDPMPEVPLEYNK
jgi:hypothetical protein